MFLALATRNRNDIYRDAAKRGLPVERVEVGVEGQCEAEIQNTLRAATPVTLDRIEAAAARP